MLSCFRAVLFRMIPKKEKQEMMVYELDTLSFFFFRNSNHNFTDFYVINLFSPSSFSLTLLSYFSKIVGV